MFGQRQTSLEGQPDLLPPCAFDQLRLEEHGILFSRDPSLQLCERSVRALAGVAQPHDRFRFFTQARASVRNDGNKRRSESLLRERIRVTRLTHLQASEFSLENE